MFEYAHQFDVTVEGELGVLAGVEMRFLQTTTLIPILRKLSTSLLVRAAILWLSQSVLLTGAYKFTPEQCTIDPVTGKMVPPPLAFDVLDAVMRNFGIPYRSSRFFFCSSEEVETINKFGGALKAAIGIPEEVCVRLLNLLYVRSISDSDSRLAMTAAIRKTFAEKPAEFDPRKYLGPARDNMEKLYKHKNHQRSLVLTTSL